MRSSDDPAGPEVPVSGVAGTFADDLALARSVLAADARAIPDFLERMRCVPRVLTVLNARIGSPLGAHDLADVTQDALILIWRKLAEYDGRAPLEAWTYALTRYEFLNASRRHRRRQDVAIALRDEARPEIDDDLGIDPEQVRLALDRLAADEAATVYARHYEGLTFEEAAARSGIAVTTLKSRYYRAVERLHHMLKSTSKHNRAGA